MIFQPGVGGNGGGLQVLDQGSTGIIANGSNWSKYIAGSPKLFFVKTSDSNATTNNCAFGWINFRAYLFAGSETSGGNRFVCSLSDNNLSIRNETGGNDTVDYCVLG